MPTSQVTRNKREGFRPCCGGCCFSHPEFTSFSSLLDKEPPSLSAHVVWEGWLAPAPWQVWGPGFSQQAHLRQLATTTGVGMGTGPKTANDSETQDFGWVSWMRSTLLPWLLGRWCLELWVADLSDLGGICPRLEPQKNRAKRLLQTGFWSHHLCP